MKDIEKKGIPEIARPDPWKFDALRKAAPRCRLMFDLDADSIRYRTIEGRARQIWENVKYNAVGDAAQVSYGYAGGPRGKITFRPGHECYRVAAIAAGILDAVDFLWDAVKTFASMVSVTESNAAYLKYAAKPDASRKKEMKEDIEYAAKLADEVACVIRLISLGGIPLFIGTIAGDLEKIAAAALEAGQAVTAAKHIAAVAAWIQTVTALCLETAQAEAEKAAAVQAEAETEERPETILVSNAAPETAENKEDETMKKYAAYYEDFPYMPRIFSAANKKEAEKGARAYRRAWGLPALIRVDCLTEEEAARLEAEKAAPEAEKAAAVQAEAETEERPETIPAGYTARKTAAGNVIMIEKTEDAAENAAPEDLPENIRETAAAVVAAFPAVYARLYDNGYDGKDVELFNAWMGTPVCNRFIGYCAKLRGDCFISDREAAAFVVACRERQEARRKEERPETIPAPEAENAAPETVAPEAAPRTAPEKPARAAAKEKPFAGEALTGRGWSIVFDTGLQRTRVIVQDGIREKAAPIIENAGFYYSKNMNSWNKKLTHKAHRAAVALADALRAALA